jgi:transcriptional regulator with XRE-family HTH domain
MNVKTVGEYIRTQRKNARLSLRKVSGLAGVSIPYLSQVERGLRKPSAEILQAIAKGLRISAETLYVQAGFLEDRSVPDVSSAILNDQAITERHKEALIQIYEAFREEAARTQNAEPTPEKSPPARQRRTTRTTAPVEAKEKDRKVSASREAATRGATAGKEPQRGGGAKSLAHTSPHPAPFRSSARNARREV